MNKTRERVWFFFILEFFVAAFCLFFGFEEQSIVALLASALVVACSLTAKLLLELLKAPWWLGALCAAVCVATIFVFAADMALPMASLLLLDVLSRLSWRGALHVAVLLSATATLLLALLFFPKPAAILGTTGAFALACVGLVLARLLERSRFDIGERDERILSLEARLKNQRTAISSIEQQGRQAERNRLAARIHDKVGHGMTGSILMLEAAQLQLDDDPKAARESIRAATENLRAGVEDIRQELREERSSDKHAGLAQIAARLDDFSATHSGVTCELETEGALDAVSQVIWICIYESLLETLTNLARHSNATCLRVIIARRDRLLTVDFSDNGSGALMASATGDPFMKRGIGLSGIEERALFSGGRAFFSLTPRGFTTRLVFSLRSAS